ncbi:MAG TPA: hypothetical protein DCE42_30990 [Myxococcales bacterium]|nr:hypothetical protein [Deltaproteobacteria bacterium]HAA59215.1 hypothetical protein [Myxococcales bacterium]|tara:strand:+ start:8368 stop:9069 length:702 start_codon:yes stop_codon:yes gene_type:complete
MSPKIVDREKRNEEILRAAFRIFVEHGYHKATLSSIAKAAGMGQGTLYYYFPSKDELFWGVYEQMMADISAKFIERLISVEDPAERLLTMLRLLFYHFPEAGLGMDDAESPLDAPQIAEEGFLGFHYVLMEFWLYAKRNGKEKDFFERLRRYQQQIIESVKSLFEQVGSEIFEGVELDVAAHMMLAMRDGLGIQLRVGIIREDDDLLDRIRDAIFANFYKRFPSLKLAPSDLP